MCLSKDFGAPLDWLEFDLSRQKIQMSMIVMIYVHEKVPNYRSLNSILPKSIITFQKYTFRTVWYLYFYYLRKDVRTYVRTCSNIESYRNFRSVSFLKYYKMIFRTKHYGTGSTIVLLIVH